MQLECPNCSTHFKVSPQALGDIGRTVRCSKCAFEWFAEPRDLKEGRHKPVHESYAPAQGDSFAAEDAPIPAEDFSEDILSALDSMNIEEAASLAKSRSGIAHTGGEGKKKPSLLPAIIAAVVGLVFFVACGIVYFNEPLRKMGLGSFYDAIGMEQVEGVKLANLSLTKLNARRTTYAIAGNVVNTSDKKQPIPSVLIRLVDTSGEVLREWDYAQKGEMKPGDVLPFNADKLDCAFLHNAHAFVIDIGGGFDLAFRD